MDHEAYLLLNYKQLTDEQFKQLANLCSLQLVMDAINLNKRAYEKEPGIKGFRNHNYPKKMVAQVLLKEYKKIKDKSQLLKGFNLELLQLMETIVGVETHEKMVNKTIDRKDWEGVLIKIHEGYGLDKTIIEKLYDIHFEISNDYQAHLDLKNYESLSKELQETKAGLEKALETIKSQEQKQAKLLQESKLAKLKVKEVLDKMKIDFDEANFDTYKSYFELGTSQDLFLLMSEKYHSKNYQEVKTLLLIQYYLTELKELGEDGD